MKTIAKDSAQTELHRIITIRNVTKTTHAGDKDAKEKWQKKLKGLEIHDKFVFEPPLTTLDNNGKPILDEISGLPWRTGKLTSPFTGPIIRNAIRILFFEKNARISAVNHAMINDYIVAFVTVLVHT